jgi:hypothetical protein
MIKHKHIEAPLSFLLLDEGEVVQPFSPLVHNVEEAINLDDEEFEYPIEDVHASTPPAHEDEKTIIFSHTDGLMKVPFDMVDEHIDTFIQTGRRSGILIISFSIETPSTTLRVALKKRGLSCHPQRTTFHVYMIHMFGSLMMT